MYLSSNDGRQPYFRAPKRAMTRARAMELDFTNGEDEEDTMCPVCHDSTHPILYLLLLGSN